jgi:hypothetical protein
MEIEETFAENSINQEDIAPVHGKRRIGKCGQVRRASLRVTDEITLSFGFMKVKFGQVGMGWLDLVRMG